MAACRRGNSPPRVLLIQLQQKSRFLPVPATKRPVVAGFHNENVSSSRTREREIKKKKKMCRICVCANDSRRAHMSVCVRAQGLCCIVTLISLQPPIPLLTPETFQRVMEMPGPANHLAMHELQPPFFFTFQCSQPYKIFTAKLQAASQRPQRTIFSSRLCLQACAFSEQLLPSLFLYRTCRRNIYTSYMSMSRQCILVETLTFRTRRISSFP